MGVGRGVQRPIWILILAATCFQQHAHAADEELSQQSDDAEQYSLVQQDGNELPEGVTLISTGAPKLISRPLITAHNDQVCSTWGNFHFKTFDGEIYHFPGTCNYLFVSNCKSPYEDFNIQIRRKIVDHIPTIDKITMHLEGETIEITDSTILINGEEVTLPCSHSGIQIDRNGMYLRVFSMEGIDFMWNDEDMMMLELDGKYANTTCGLCGDFNDIRDNEFYMNGVKMTPREFGNLQKMNGPTEECNDLEVEPLNNCTDHHKYCESILTSGPFHDCNAAVDVRPYIEACVQDLCRCNNNESHSFCLCNNFAEYSRQCSHSGSKPQNWRTPDLCPITCPFNMNFEECGMPCVDTCSNNEQSALCDDHCSDGCFCPAGRVFDDFTDRGCIEEAECACIFNDKIYTKGTGYQTACHSCTCFGGTWTCTDLPCVGTCSVEGGSHIRTFDEKDYNFHGDCSYELAKDCSGNSFKVLAELRTCGKTETETCLKSVTISLNGGDKTFFIKPCGTVLMDMAVTDLPIIADGATVFQPSKSFIIAQTNNGLQVEVQIMPTMGVRVRLEPHLEGKTCGLCGNFNKNPADDFKTTTGVVEGTGPSFGNHWRTQNDCPTILPNHEDPCSGSVDNERYAEHWCEMLSDPEGPFTSCHAMVNPNVYEQNCRFDTCNCEKTEDCMCAAVSSYVRACAAKDVFLTEWRNTICGKYSEDCPKTWVYSDKVDTCQASCRSLSEPDMSCSVKFTPVDGCVCPEGTYLDERKNCVNASACSCYYKGSPMLHGESVREHNAICTCSQGKISCIGVTVKDPECTAPMVYLDCANVTEDGKGSECQKSCQTLDVECFSTHCVSGCVCPQGMVLDRERSCIQEETCPCVHNEVTYQPGEEISVSCNTCTCKNRMWQCTDKPCFGTCSVYGDGHYITFDSKRYSFNGDCEYTVAQDYCGNSNGTFRVITENIPCGTTGTTCSKSMKVFLGGTELIFHEGHMDVVTRDSNVEVPYKVRSMGIYTVLEASNGFVLLWDKKTSMFMKLSSKFQGKVCGLCGNFDSNGMNDLTTRSQSIVGDVFEFGSSWKSNPTCPDVLEAKDPCSANPYRKAWAQKQCSIIKSVAFSACHSQVDPSKYYEACVSDSCACDTGGDCECFCTAVAAYAQACNEFDICIHWRTPNICPLFCDFYNRDGDCEWHYKPCGAPCMKTCVNPSGKCLYDLPGLEGCYPNCPADRPYFDEENMACTAACGCYDKQGNLFRPGDKVHTDESCKSCTCNKDEFICSYDLEACICVYDGKKYRYNEVIYRTKDILGECFIATCAVNGTIRREITECTTTAPPTTFNFTTGPPTSSVTTERPSTTVCVQEVCSWTDWLAYNHPEYDICKTPRDAQCRVAEATDDTLKDPEQEDECRPAIRQICNKDQVPSQQCHNYEVRYKCCSHVSCGSTSPSTSTTTSSTTTRTEETTTRSTGTNTVPTTGSETTQITQTSSTTTRETTISPSTVTESTSPSTHPGTEPITTTGRTTLTVTGTNTFPSTATETTTVTESTTPSKTPGTEPTTTTGSTTQIVTGTTTSPSTTSETTTVTESTTPPKTPGTEPTTTTGSTTQIVTGTTTSPSTTSETTTVTESTTPSKTPGTEPTTTTGSTTQIVTGTTTSPSTTSETTTVTESTTPSKTTGTEPTTTTGSTTQIVTGTTTSPSTTSETTTITESTTPSKTPGKEPTTTTGSTTQIVTGTTTSPSTTSETTTVTESTTPSKTPGTEPTTTTGSTTQVVTGTTTSPSTTSETTTVTESITPSKTPGTEPTTTTGSTTQIVTGTTTSPSTTSETTTVTESTTPLKTPGTEPTTTTGSTTQIVTGTTTSPSTTSETTTVTESTTPSKTPGTEPTTTTGSTTQIVTGTTTSPSTTSETTTVTESTTPSKTTGTEPTTTTGSTTQIVTGTTTSPSTTSETTTITESTTPSKTPGTEPTTTTGSTTQIVTGTTTSPSTTSETTTVTESTTPSKTPGTEPTTTTGSTTQVVTGTTTSPSTTSETTTVTESITPSKTPGTEPTTTTGSTTQIVTGTTTSPSTTSETTTVTESTTPPKTPGTESTTTTGSTTQIVTGTTTSLSTTSETTTVTESTTPSKTPGTEPTTTTGSTTQIVTGTTTSPSTTSETTTVTESTTPSKTTGTEPTTTTGSTTQIVTGTTTSPSTTSETTTVTESTTPSKTPGTEPTTTTGSTSQVVTGTTTSPSTTSETTTVTESTTPSNPPGTEPTTTTGTSTQIVTGTTTSSSTTSETTTVTESTTPSKTPGTEPTTTTGSTTHIVTGTTTSPSTTSETTTVTEPTTPSKTPGTEPTTTTGSTTQNVTGTTASPSTTSETTTVTEPTTPSKTPGTEPTTTTGSTSQVVTGTTTSPSTTSETTTVTESTTPSNPPGTEPTTTTGSTTHIVTGTTTSPSTTSETTTVTEPTTPSKTPGTEPTTTTGSTTQNVTGTTASPSTTSETTTVTEPTTPSKTLGTEPTTTTGSTTQIVTGTTTSPSTTSESTTVTESTTPSTTPGTEPTTTTGSTTQIVTGTTASPSTTSETTTVTEPTTPSKTPGTEPTTTTGSTTQIGTGTTTSASTTSETTTVTESTTPSKTPGTEPTTTTGSTSQIVTGTTTSPSTTSETTTVTESTTPSKTPGTEPTTTTGSTTQVVTGTTTSPSTTSETTTVTESTTPSKTPGTEPTTTTGSTTQIVTRTTTSPSTTSETTTVTESTTPSTTPGTEPTTTTGSTTHIVTGTATSPSTTSETTTVTELTTPSKTPGTEPTTTTGSLTQIVTEKTTSPSTTSETTKVTESTTPSKTPGTEPTTTTGSTTQIVTGTTTSPSTSSETTTVTESTTPSKTPGTEPTTTTGSTTHIVTGTTASPSTTSETTTVTESTTPSKTPGTEPTTTTGSTSQIVTGTTTSPSTTSETTTVTESTTPSKTPGTEPTTTTGSTTQVVTGTTTSPSSTSETTTVTESTTPSKTPGTEPTTTTGSTTQIVTGTTTSPSTTSETTTVTESTTPSKTPGTEPTTTTGRTNPSTTTTTVSTEPSTVTESTSPLVTPCKPSCTWTPWIDDSVPSSKPDDGDNEKFQNITAPVKTICEKTAKISDIECRDKNFPDKDIDTIDTNEKCNTTFGLVCNDADQPADKEVKMCYNYMIRVLCCDMSHCTTPGTTPSSTITETTTPSTETTPTSGSTPPIVTGTLTIPPTTSETTTVTKTTTLTTTTGIKTTTSVVTPPGTTIGATTKYPSISPETTGRPTTTAGTPSTPKTPEGSSTTITTAVTTTCHCQIGDTLVSPGGVIYNVTDKDGCTYYAICNHKCTPEKYQGPCTTPNPTGPSTLPQISTVTSTVATSHPSTSESTTGTSTPSTSERAPTTTPRTSAVLPLTVTHPTTGLPDMCVHVHPFRKVNETWPINKCANATCQSGGNITIKETECPAVKQVTCEGGLAPKQVYDQKGCCFQYECESCVGPDGKSKMPGETWTSNCQTCSCDKETISVQCVPMKCEESTPPTCDEEGYQLVEEVVPDNPCCTKMACKCNPRLCFPNVKKCNIGFRLSSIITDGDCCAKMECVPEKVCVFNNATYQPGSDIPQSKGSCQVCDCSEEINPETQLHNVNCEPVNCKTDCGQGYEYTTKSGECCGECVQKACVMKTENNETKVIEVGDSWNPPGNNCTYYECHEIEDKFVPVTVKKMCADLEPEDCAVENIVMSSDGCCKVCKGPQTQSCKPRTIPTVLSHGACNTTVEMSVCEGLCSSSSEFSSMSKSMEHKCTCCQELKTRKQEVKMTCADGSDIDSFYIIVEECGCVGTVCLPQEGTQPTEEQSRRRRRR